MSRFQTNWLVVILAAPTLSISAPKKAAATSEPVAVLFPREGGAYGLGSIWFDREPVPEPVPQPEGLSPDIQSGKEPEDVEEPENSLSFDLTWNLTTAGIYETRPAHHASDHPDWHWDTELAPELECSITEHFSISTSAGLRFARFASGPDLDSDEPFASIQATWRFAAHWMTFIRHESFWDLAPGFGEQVFAAHTTDLRLQYDTTDIARPKMLRWQIYTEAAHSFAEPSLHDYFGFAIGGGCAIRLVPQRLRFQIGAGLSYQTYPNYHVDTVHRRQGWNTHTSAALVWTPTDHGQVSLGLDFMHSAENGSEFHFNNLAVPLSIHWSW